jgi:hypothetical protein
VNVEHPIALVDAVHGTFINACPVFDINTGQSDYIRHCGSVLSGLPASLS